MRSALALVDDPLFGRHRPPSEHPERPERLDAARAGLARAHLGLACLPVEPRDASDAELTRVHQLAYIDRLGQAAGRSGYLDPDTYFSPESVAAARRAAGGSIALVDALRDGEASVGLALVRPPGHHARPGSAMGFCLLNNVAVAAAHARARGASRVAILDWDVHHGNGTQEMFYADPSVLYLSLHQYPFYPGTGAADEVGEGEGRGSTVNVPLSQGADDAVYEAAFSRVIAPIIEQFDPDLVLVSAGFDAHRHDPLAAMKLGEQAYGEMTRRLVAALPRGASGRLAFLLEGGYDLRALSDSLTSTLEAVEDTAVAPEPGVANVSARHEAELRRVETVQKQFWRLA